jgi:hypothetical protein
MNLKKHLPTKRIRKIRKEINSQQMVGIKLQTLIAILSQQEQKIRTIPRQKNF